MLVIAEKKVIVVATVLMIVTAFQDGLKHLEKKEYDQAIAKFTVVIDKNVPGNTLRELALYYRARAYVGKGDRKAARDDLLKLIDLTDDETLSMQATTLFKQAGGKAQLLEPIVSPTKTWNLFVAAAQKGDNKKALEFCGGQMYAMMKYYEALANARGFNVLSQFTAATVTAERIGTGKEDGKAWLTLTAQNARMTVTVDVVRRKRAWVMTSYAQVWNQNAVRVVTNAKVDPDESARTALNKTSLKKLGLALALWANDHNEAYPARLADLAPDYVSEKGQLVWENPRTGKKLAWIYYAKTTPRSEPGTLVAAAPLSVNGKRCVLHYDGHVSEMADKDFFAKAKAQQWALPAVADKTQIKPEGKKEILALIRQLGDKDYRVRHAAKRKLAEIGTDAIPFLEENKNSPDPEVRLTIKELLEE